MYVLVRIPVRAEVASLYRSHSGFAVRCDIFSLVLTAVTVRGGRVWLSNTSDLSRPRFVKNVIGVCA